jgi:eukaryotic-like serine/threonine-protein kinase
MGKDNPVKAGLVLGGRYRLLERLAVSGMSEVWTAHDLELERRVAVKLLGRDADPERFEREAQAAAALSHPNICRLYDYGEIDGRRYIVLELLSGGSLEDRLPWGRPLSDPDAARIAQELASALAYAHAEGIVHRDVKPTNVLFDDDGRAKLTDFGIARLTDASTLTEAGTILGTAAYIAPEQARGESVGPAADVYAFGVILYRMLTGQLPFEAENPIHLAAMHAAETPRSIASLRGDAPPGLERLAMRALAKSPQDRPPDGSALLAELADTEDRTEVLAPAAGRRIRPRHLAAGAGLAAIAIAGAAAAVLITAEPSQAPVTGRKPAATTRPHTGRSGDTPTAPSAATTATTDSTSTASTSTRPRTIPTERSPLPTTTAPNTATLPATGPTTTETEPTTETTTTAATTTEATTTVSTTTP